MVAYRKAWCWAICLAVWAVFGVGHSDARKPPRSTLHISAWKKAKPALRVMRPTLTTVTPKQTGKPAFGVRWVPSKVWGEMTRRQRPGVVMTYDEWRKKWHQFHRRLRAQQTPKQAASAFQALRFEGEVKGQQLHWKMKLRVQLLKIGWHTLSLPLRGMRVASVELKGLKGSLRRVGQAYRLHVLGQGLGTIALTGVSKIKKTPSGRVFALSFPSTARSMLRFHLPAGQEVRLNQSGFQVSTGQKETLVWGGLQKGSNLTLTFRAVEGQARQDGMLSAKVDSFYDIRAGLQWLDTIVQLRVSLGERQVVKLAIPKGFNLVDIKGQSLSHFAVDKKKGLLTISLRERARRGRSSFRLRWVRKQAAKQLALRPLRVLSTYEQTGMIVLGVAALLDVRLGTLRHARRVEVGRSGQHFGKLRREVLAFSTWRQDALVQLSVKPTPLHFEIEQSLHVACTERQARLTAMLTVQVRSGRLHKIRWKHQPGWQLSELLDRHGRAIHHWKKDGFWHVEWSKPLQRGRKHILRLSLLKSLTLPEKGKVGLEVPSFDVEGAKRQEGELTFSYPSFYDGRMHAAARLRRLPLYNPKKGGTTHIERWKILGVPYKGRLVLSRRASRVQLLTVSRYVLKQDALEGDLDVYFHITGAGTKKLSLVLRHGQGLNLQWMPRRARIVEKHKRVLKDGTLLLDLTLSREHFGRLAMTLRFKKRFEKTPSTLALPMLSGRGIVERGYLAVYSESSSKIKVTPLFAQEVDPLAVPSPLQSGMTGSALFAYRYSQSKRQLTLQRKALGQSLKRRPVVRHFSLHGLCEGGDVMKVKATYQLDNQGLSVFQATLPAKAELWGVDVQGRGVKPMAKGQHVRIALPQQGRGLVTVRLHYSIKLADSLPARSGAIKILAPKVSYPIIQSAWMVYAPHKYRPVGMRSPFPVSGVLKPRALVETIVKVVKRYPTEVFILVLFLLGLILRVHLLALLSWMFRTFVWLVRELFVSPWRWGTALSALLVIGVLSIGVLINKDMSPQRLARRYEMPPTNNLREESKSGGKSRWRTKATKNKKEVRYYRKKKTYDFDDDTVSGSLRRSGRGGGRPQGNFALKVPPRKARRYRRRRPAAPRSAPRRVTSRLNQPTELPKIVAKPKPIPESIVKAPPPPPAQDGQPIVTTPKKQVFLPPGKDSKPKSGELDRIEDQKSKNAQKMGEKVRDLIRSEGLLGKKGKVEKKEDGKGRHDAFRQQAKHRFKRPDGSKSTLTLVDKEKAQRLANTKRVLDGNFDARLMRGIRSLEVKEAPMGWWIRTAGLGALEEVQVTLWREEWLRTSLIIVFLFAFLLWFVLGTLMASRRALLVVGGVLLTAAAGFLVQGVWVLFANALTAGILAAGLLLVLRKQVSGAVTAIVLFGLLSGATPQAHAASPDCQWFTITQNAVKYPSKVSLYAAYQKGQTPSLRGKTPVFVPYTWWAMLGRAPEPRCFRVPKAAAYWVQTAYKAKILSAKRSVEGIASFDVRILKKGTYRIPLGLSGVSAKLLKTSFPLALGYGKHGYEVVLSGPGRFVIPLSFTVPLHTKRQLSLSLAKHAVAGMRLELDGTKWSFQSPQAAEGMHVASTKNKTFVHILLGGEKKLQVSWRPSSLKGQTELENANVLSYHHVTLRQHLLRFRSRYLFRRRYQKTTRFIFDMPANASLEAVRSKDLRSWRYQTQKGNKQLVVVLEKPVKTADIVVRYVLLRKKLKEKWALPFLRPNQIARHRGFLGFRADGVQSTLLGTAGMEKQSAAEYRSSTSAWGGAVTEAFAFRQLPSLQIVLRPKVSKLRVRASQMMVIGAQRDQLSSELTIRGDVSEQFTLSFLLSKGWTIREVRSLRGVPVRQTWMGQATKTHQILFVEFKRPVMRGQKLLIQAERWSHQTLRVFPTLVPSRVHELRGTLAIAAPVDYELQTEALKSLKTRERYGLRPVGLRLPEQTNIQLGYTFQRRYSGQLRWEKKQETSRCKGTFHVDIYESTALLTGKLHFRASGVGVRQWSFSVPTALAKRIEIKTAPGVKLTRKASKGRTLFTLRHALLRTSFLQSLRLRLDVSRKGVVSIPSIQPEGTISHVSWLFLRKTPQVRLFVEKPKGAGIRPLLPASMNRKSMGKDVVSAFEIKRGGWTLSVRREVLKTEVSFRPLVELGHLETTFTEQGQAWTRATYTLRSAGLQFLTFSLPRGGSLWSVRVRGKVVYPTKNAGVYMIPLPPRQSSDLAYDIECLYAHKVQLPSVFGSVALQPPHIAPVEVSQTYWTVYAPKSWRVRSHAGNMDRATLMQMEVAQLKRSFDFFHKLQKLAHTGDAVEKARAKANIKRQWSEVQNTLKRARQQMDTLRYRKKNAAVKKSYRQSRTQFYRLSGAISADSVKANRYLRQSRQSTHALTVWQRKFGVSLQSAEKAVGQRKTTLATLSFLRTGKRSTYATGGGRPTLSLRVSRAGLTKTILGWAGWVLLLLVFLIAGWRRWL